jgi:hypothetical protein
MPQYRLMAVTNAQPGREAEFERWYDEQHLPDLMKVPGVIGAQRFRTVAGMEGPLTWRFVTLYTLDTEDLAGVMQELGRRINTPDMPLTDAGDFSAGGAVMVELVGGIGQTVV